MEKGLARRKQVQGEDITHQQHHVKTHTIKKNPNPNPVCVFCLRLKQDGSEADLSMSKNSYNNPAYYILEGVPNQSAAAISPELLPSPTSANPPVAKAPPHSRSKPSYVTSGHCPRRAMTGHQVCAINEEGSSEDDGGAQGGVGNTLNRPPPDFPPPPLPKGALEMVTDPPFSKTRPIYPELAEHRGPAASLTAPLATGESFRRGGAGALDDQSCSVLQMAKSLSESEFQGQPPRASSAPPPIRGHPISIGLDASCSFPVRHTITESIAEDLPEEVSKWASC